MLITEALSLYHGNPVCPILALETSPSMAHNVLAYFNSLKGKKITFL